MSIRPKKQSPAEAFLTLLNDEMLDRRVSFPAQITAINIGEGNSLQSIDVLPLTRQTVSQENTDELIYRDLPILANVPVVFPHCTVSGYSLTIPIQIGGQVLIVIADRSIDEWQASGGTGRPVESATPRAHDLTDAIAIIGISCDVKNVKNYRFDRMEMRNVDGTVYVSLKDDEVEIEVADSTITVNNSEIDIRRGTSNINMTANSIDITADIVTINGASLVLASTAITVTTSDLVSAGGTSLSTHIHTSGGAGNPTSQPL